MVPLVRMEIPIVPMGPFRHATTRSELSFRLVGYRLGLTSPP